jgi:DNA repair exonuclease SbcCD nuclease subunit
MSKLAIVGDLHFGKKNNNEQLLEAQLKWFYDSFVPTMDEQGCDKVIFLGDIFDNRVSLSPLILKHVRTLFYEICQKYEVHVIVGNHDCFYRNTNDVHSLGVLEDQGARVYHEITQVDFFGKTSLILPWLTKDTLDKAESMLAKNNYAMCFGHLEINGFEMAKNHIATHGMTQDTFFNCRKVYSGHFHIRNVDGQIKYVGTPYELDWGDYLEEKGFTILDTKTMEEEYFLNKVSPKHMKIRSEEIDIEDLTPEFIGDNYVEIEFHEGISQTDRIMITEKLESLGPSSIRTKEEKLHSMGTDDIEVDDTVKNSLDALFEYTKLIGCPEGLDESKALEIIKDIYERCDQ